LKKSSSRELEKAGNLYENTKYTFNLKKLRAQSGIEMQAAEAKTNLGEIKTSSKGLRA
jgi:hypothetical protein